MVDKDDGFGGNPRAVTYDSVGSTAPYKHVQYPKPWVGLTGTEINHIFAANVGHPERMVQAVEALLKEKNGG
jgi:hypothetical protein